MSSSRTIHVIISQNNVTDRRVPRRSLTRCGSCGPCPEGRPLKLAFSLNNVSKRRLDLISLLYERICTDSVVCGADSRPERATATFGGIFCLTPCFCNTPVLPHLAPVFESPTSFAARKDPGQFFARFTVWTDGHDNNVQDFLSIVIFPSRISFQRTVELDTMAPSVSVPL